MTNLEWICLKSLIGQVTWFGLEESREFWDFISAICGSLPHNCLDSIATMEEAKSAKAKVHTGARDLIRRSIKTHSMYIILYPIYILYIYTIYMYTMWKIIEGIKICRKYKNM